MTSDDDLYTLVETSNHQPLKLYVYNAESDTSREVRGKVRDLLYLLSLKSRKYIDEEFSVGFMGILYKLSTKGANPQRY